MKEQLKNKKSVLWIIVAVVYWIVLALGTWLACKYTTKDMVGFRYQVPFLLGCLFVLSGNLFVVWLVAIKKAKLHNIYLGISFVLLSLFLWTQTPLHHHDNEFHYDSTYVMSNILMGEESSVGIAGGRVKTYPRRECDEFMHYCAYNNFIHAYADMQREMFSQPKEEKTELIERKTYQGAVSEPLYFYIPQALGFCVARVLELNMYWLLYLGRLFLAIASVFITWRAIKNAPAYKEVFLNTGLLPTTLWSYVTVSRDALIIAFSIYFTSKCLQIVYSEKKVNWWDYALMFGSLLLLSPYKLVYIPLALLLALLICKKHKEGKFNIKVMGIVSGAVIVVGVFFVIINFDYIRQYLMGTNTYALDGSMPFTLPYILTHPIEALLPVVRTMVRTTVRFVANMIIIGDYGGGIHKEMALLEMVFIFIIILWNNNRKKSREEICFTVVERCIITGTWLAVSGMIYLAYLLVTPRTSDVIIGIQGRYFTPVLPLMLLSFCGMNRVKNIKNKYWIKIMDFLDSSVMRQGIILGLYGLGLFVIVNMFAWVMTYVHPV